MRPVTRPLVFLHSDPALRQRMRRLARGRFCLRWVEEWSGLPDALREAGPAGVIVVDPYHRQPPRKGVSPELPSLMRRFPSATVVAALCTRPDWLSDIRALGEWGVAAVLDLDAESTDRAILQGILDARSRPLRSVLDRSIGASLTGQGRAIVEAAVETATAGDHSRDLAEKLHLHRDTLLRWCQQAGLPPPRRLLVWMRVLLAADLLDNPGQTVESIAYACGYSQADALSRAIDQRLGMRPRVLRAKGAFRIASAAFREELRAFQGNEAASAAGRA